VGAAGPVSISLPRTLFLSRALSVAAWYRMILPAIHLGCDWVGVAGRPPGWTVGTGNVGGALTEADVAGYEVVVLQAQRGAAWEAFVHRLRDAGVIVLFEIDDYAHSIRRVPDHDFARVWDKEALRELDAVMRACDGLIASTPYLAQQYQDRTPRTWVCRNGIDLPRYDLTLPARDDVVIGWAGATGHGGALRPWLGEISAVMDAREDTRFVTIGQPFADELAGRFGERRTLSLPFGPLETYPAAMTHFDVALAPAGDSGFFLAKSDLRWLEASALGIPAIADPVVYPDIDHGVTGFHARTPAQAREAMLALAADRELRRGVGQAARTVVRETRSMEAMAPQWAAALGEAAGAGPV
jgi:glycosyltransferase involved in cell wall biosynthesis